MPKTTAGYLIPTAAQVHVAISVLAHIQQTSSHECLCREAEQAIRIALAQEGWDGATPTCPPFGALVPMIVRCPSLPLSLEDLSVQPQGLCRPWPLFYQDKKER